MPLTKFTKTDPQAWTLTGMDPNRFIDWSKQPVEFWSNSTYFVCANRSPSDEIGLIAIRRRDWKPCLDWRDKQAIKNEIVGPEREAAELYPAGNIFPHLTFFILIHQTK